MKLKKINSGRNENNISEYIFIRQCYLWYTWYIWFSLAKVFAKVHFLSLIVSL